MRDQYASNYEYVFSPPPVHMDMYHNDVDVRQWECIFDGDLDRWVFSHHADDKDRFQDMLQLRNKLKEIEERDANPAIEMNEKGGKQSLLETRYDLVPSSAIHEVAKVLKVGAEKYGADNWRKIPVESHVNHALEHLYKHLEKIRQGEGDETYDLAHAATRLLFALAVDQDGENE